MHNQQGRGQKNRKLVNPRFLYSFWPRPFAVVRSISSMELLEPGPNLIRVLFQEPLDHLHGPSLHPRDRFPEYANIFLTIMGLKFDKASTSTFVCKLALFISVALFVSPFIFLYNAHSPKQFLLLGHRYLSPH